MVNLLFIIHLLICEIFSELLCQVLRIESIAGWRGGGGSGGGEGAGAGEAVNFLHSLNLHSSWGEIDKPTSKI